MLLLCTALLGGCDALGGPDTSLDLAFSQLGRSTPQERSRSLFQIRQAWEYRPDGTGDEVRRAERRFLNRYGAFAKTLVRTESARDAAQLWRRIYTDHTHRFPDVDD
jgi:hypothetical protein